MASFTNFLKLLKKNPATEGSDSFNVQTMLNDNWDKIDAFADVIGGKSVARCKVGSYVGTGVSSADAPMSITDIGFVPDFVYIAKYGGNFTGFRYGFNSALVRGVSKFYEGSSDSFIRWGVDSVEWYCDESSYCCNDAGTVYYYVIIGHEEVSE